jgi:predicted nucleotidyltransferase
MTPVAINRPTAATVPPALIEAVRRHFSVVDLWLFGSRARGDHRPDSDWDLLVVVPDDREDLTDPYVGWLARQEALEAGIDSTVVAATETDVRTSWGLANTLCHDLARDGIRLNVS